MALVGLVSDMLACFLPLLSLYQAFIQPLSSHYQGCIKAVLKLYCGWIAGGLRVLEAAGAWDRCLLVPVEEGNSGALVPRLNHQHRVLGGCVRLRACIYACIRAFIEASWRLNRHARDIVVRKAARLHVCLYQHVHCLLKDI